MLRRIPIIEQSYKYPDVYQVIMSEHIQDGIVRMDTYTGLYIDLENGNVIYTFFYNIKDNPEVYQLWIRS